MKSIDISWIMGYECSNKFYILKQISSNLPLTSYRSSLLINFVLPGNGNNSNQIWYQEMVMLLHKSSLCIMTTASDTSIDKHEVVICDSNILCHKYYKGPLMHITLSQCFHSLGIEGLWIEYGKYMHDIVLRNLFNLEWWWCV